MTAQSAGSLHSHCDGWANWASEMPSLSAQRLLVIGVSSAGMYHPLSVESSTDYCDQPQSKTFYLDKWFTEKIHKIKHRMYFGNNTFLWITVTLKTIVSILVMFLRLIFTAAISAQNISCKSKTALRYRIMASWWTKVRRCKMSFCISLYEQTRAYLLQILLLIKVKSKFLSCFLCLQPTKWMYKVKQVCTQNTNITLLPMHQGRW